MTYSVIVIRDEDQLIPAAFILTTMQCRSMQETQASLIVLVLIVSY